jgi:uncharacterized membrane protein
MYTLIKSISIKQMLTKQIPTLGMSFIIAELFYKFHSFTLECLAFLITWFVLDAVINYLVKIFNKDIKQFEHEG